MEGARVTRIVLVALLGALLALGVTGCQRVAERAVEETTGISVEDDGDTITMQTDEGEVSVSGGEGTLPDDWPSDMPVYPDAQIVSSTAMRSDDQTAFTLTMTTTDTFDAVFDWYRDELVSGGWTIENEFSMETNGERTGNLAASKGGIESLVWVNEVEGEVGIGTQVQGE